jgi:hypothetical protein
LRRKTDGGIRRKKQEHKKQRQKEVKGGRK